MTLDEFMALVHLLSLPVSFGLVCASVWVSRRGNYAKAAWLAALAVLFRPY